MEQLERARVVLAAAAPRDMPAARDAMGHAVLAARAAHCTWGEIAEVLGMARGNAYQQYRPKLTPSTPRPDAPPM